MKKTFVGIALAMLLLTGCSEDSYDYDINKNVTITDMTIDKMTAEGGRYTTYKIWFKKGETVTEFEVDSFIYRDIEDLRKTTKMLGNKELKYDIITDGDYIETITLSKNRK